jgi:hypothetical protein
VGSQSALLVEAGGSTNATAGTSTASIGLTRADLDGNTPTFTLDNSWVESRKRALDFDGINDFVAIPTNTQLSSTNSAYTLEAWIKPDTTGALGIIGWGNWGSTNQSNALRLTGSDQLVNYWWGNDLTVTSGNLADGRWHHVAATFDGTVRRIFVDGVQKGFDTPTGLNVASTISNARIGFTNNGEYFDGAIDDVGIWNRALTQQEITNLYNSTSTSECLTMTINTGVLSTNPETYTSTVNIYPNPANDQITIDCGNLANVVGWNIKITNMLGQEVFNQPMNTQQYVVPLNSWSGQGMYFVKIINAQNEVVNIKKIIFCLDQKYYIMSPFEFTRHHTTEGQHYVNSFLQIEDHFPRQEDEYF